MNISQLPYFIAIAATGSLSSAARELGVSQPALSNYLSELEQETGLELFYRHKKRLTPTPAGRLYLEAAQNITGLWERVKSAVHTMDDPILKTIRIGVSPHRGTLLLADIYPHFNRRYPDYAIVPQEGYADTLHQLLMENTIDLAITGGFPKDGLRFYPLRREEVVLAVPSYHSAVKTPCGVFEKLPVADLAEFRTSVFIMPTGTTSLKEIIRPLFARAGFEPQVALATPNVIMEQRMVAAGAGVALLPAYYVTESPDLSFFRLRDTEYMVAGYFTREGYALSEAERYLIYLNLRHQVFEEPKTRPEDIDWSSDNRGIVWEFDPSLARSLNLEEP